MTGSIPVILSIFLFPVIFILTAQALYNAGAEVVYATSTPIGVYMYGASFKYIGNTGHRYFALYRMEGLRVFPFVVCGMSLHNKNSMMYEKNDRL